MNTEQIRTDLEAMLLVNSERNSAEAKITTDLKGNWAIGTKFISFNGNIYSFSHGVVRFVENGFIVGDRNLKYHLLSYMFSTEHIMVRKSPKGNWTLKSRDNKVLFYFPNASPLDKNRILFYDNLTYFIIDLTKSAEDYEKIIAEFYEHQDSETKKYLKKVLEIVANTFLDKPINDQETDCD